MKAHIRTVIINTLHRENLVHFWSELLGVNEQSQDDEAGITWLVPDEAGGVNLGLQQVEKKLSTHTETHVDIGVNNLDDAQALIESLGGSLKKRNTLDNGFEWRVMTDPEDNEFCIFVEG